MRKFIKDNTNFTLIGNAFIILFQYDVIIRVLVWGKERLDGFRKLLGFFYASCTAFIRVGGLRFLTNECRDIPLHPVYIRLLFILISKHNSSSLTEFRIHVGYLRLLDDFWLTGVFFPMPSVRTFLKHALSSESSNISHIPMAAECKAFT